MAKEVKQWITIKGRHIPIMEGESKADVIKRLKEGAKKGKESRPKTEEAKKKDVRKKENEWKEASRDHAKKFDSNWNDPTPRKKANLEKAGKKLGETAHAYGEAIKQKAIKSAKFNKKESSAGNKESLVKKPEASNSNGSKDLGPKPSREFGDALYSGSVRKVTTELKNYADGTDISFKTPGGRKTFTRFGTGFVDNEGRVYSNMSVAGLAVNSWKHGSDSTLAGFYENNLRIVTPEMKKDKVKEIPKKSSAAVSSGKGSDAISRTASRLQKKGYNDPESIEKHLRELSPVRRNRLAQELGVTGRGDEKIKAMTQKIHEAQGGKKTEPAKTWQDKDAEVKAKQIANADKQKAERNVVRHYGSEIEDEQFRKDALAEMRRYKNNWDFYSAKERQNIAPNGIKELDARIKEIEDYEKQKAERNNAAKSPYRSTKKSTDRLLNPINEHEYRVSNNEDVKAAIQDASKRIFDNEELTGHAMQMKYDNMKGFWHRGSAVVTRRKNQWNLSPDDTGGARKALMQAHYEVTGETKKPGNKFNYKDRETARKVFEKSSYIMSKLEEESVPEKKAPVKFNAKESMNNINELSKKRNNGGKTEDDWKSVRDTLDKAPAGTVMISNGERGSQSHYKKLKDGSWESMSGYNKGETKTSKLISMGWAGHAGSSPQVEFTTEKKMAAAKAKAQASVDKAFKKAADIPGIKSNKSTLTRSGSSIYLDLDRADITEANIKALTKKGWIRRGHMDDTWIYSAKSRK